VTLADGVAALMVVGLGAYALTGGADFGGGVWDLFAGGPREAEQRRLVEKAIAPVWEANHVWLIFVVVLLFSGFPAAFAVIGTALHIPLTLVLLGIVARGSAFIFRQYGSHDAVTERRWGRLFAVASVVTPVFLGVCLGAITSGELKMNGNVPAGGFFRPWLGVLPFATGGLVLAMCAFLAATYLACEAESDALKDDFRRRALASGVLVAPFAALTAFTGDRLRETLLASPVAMPIQLAAAVAAVSALAALYARRFPLARALAAGQMLLLLVGWALAQRPYLIAPDVTLESAAAPPASLLPIVITSLAGGVFLVPSLYWMMRVLKR
jgi:cytochrome d ubiquinol oxidase subunit II